MVTVTPEIRLSILALWYEGGLRLTFYDMQCICISTSASYACTVASSFGVVPWLHEFPLDPVNQSGFFPFSEGGILKCL